MFKKVIRAIANWSMEAQLAKDNHEGEVLAQNEMLEGLQGGVFVYRISNGFLMRDLPSGNKSFGETAIPTLIYAADEVGIANAIIANQAAAKLGASAAQAEMFRPQEMTSSKTKTYTDTVKAS